MTQTEMILRLILFGLLMWLNGFLVCLAIETRRKKK